MKKITNFFINKKPLLKNNKIHFSNKKHHFENERKEFFSNTVDELKQKLKHDSNLNSKIEESIKLAQKNAQKNLNKEIYKALSWPINILQYFQYLYEYVVYIPRESGNKIWRMPEHSSSTQEVFDRLLHFLYLINQKLSDDTTVQSDEWFKCWLIRFAEEWGSFLDTPFSFNDAILESFIKDPIYRVEDSMVIGPKHNLVPNTPRYFN
jgi:phosphatidylserine decarboxylase